METVLLYLGEHALQIILSGAIILCTIFGREKSAEKLEKAHKKSVERLEKKRNKKIKQAKNLQERIEEKEKENAKY